MKVLFLDIDGVVNCVKTTQRHGPFVGIDPAMAERVKRIIKETGCEVVLSSTWRLTDSSRAEVQKKVCDFIDVTASLPSNFRGSEIDVWMRDHPEIERYAILDDNTDFHPAQRLFKTSWSTGLTDEIADEVINYLNGK